MIPPVDSGESSVTVSTVKRRFTAATAISALAVSLLIGAASPVQAAPPEFIAPEYVADHPTFARVQTDPGFRQTYHYAPQFQPVENQCANVMHGNWARVNCWTDDGKNLLVRVEFLHPYVKPAAIRVKHDTAHQVSGGQLLGKNKQFEIPADQRTPEGNPYAIFNLEYFEGQSFQIRAFAQSTQNPRAWPDFELSVTQNVNRNTDTEPWTARQATVYDSNFYKLSQPLQFEKIVALNGQYKAVYTMVSENADEADNIDQIQVWPVDAQKFTWRQESDDGNWRPYIQSPTRPFGCDASNTDVPRLGYNGYGANTDFITYTKNSTAYPLLRDGAKTSIMVDIKPGQERIQYETWMNGCANPFGRPGQMRPYQGQATIPPYALLEVRKALGGNGATAATKANLEFGGTVNYPAGRVSESYADASGWAGLDWTGTGNWNYSAGTINWAATAANPWHSPLLPADAIATITETATPNVVGGAWQQLTPDPIKLGHANPANLTAIGSEKTPATAATPFAPGCLAPAQFESALAATAGKTDGQATITATATVANLLTLQACQSQNSSTTSNQPQNSHPAKPSTPVLANSGTTHKGLAATAIVLLLLGIGTALRGAQANRPPKYHQ